MKASQLISKLAELIDDYGDLDVKIQILTEKGNNDYQIDDVDDEYEYIYDVDEDNGECLRHFSITHEVDDIRSFKKGF